MVYFDRILLTYANLQFGFKKADYFSNSVKSFFVVVFFANLFRIWTNNLGVDGI